MTTINFEDVKLNDSERHLRPVSEFNKGKKSEFYSRVCFCESKAVNMDAFDIAAE